MDPDLVDVALTPFERDQPAVHAVSQWEQAIASLREDESRRSLVIDGYYDDPLLEAAKRYHASAEWQAILGLLPKGGDALDVGAGRGIATYALAHSGFRVTALEPDSSDLVGAGAIRRLALDADFQVEAIQENSEFLPVADSQFDLVFARAVLHHTSDLSSACREFARVLRPGGILLAVREHVISRPEHLQAFLDSHPLHHLYGGENAFLLEDYSSAIQLAGLDLEQVLAPFESPINFAPRSEAELRAELSRRIGARLFRSQTLIEGFLRLDSVWKPLRTLLSHFDHRPGRLYSFVARKP
jgi:SAM-dependent methyltransferase